MNTSPGLHPPGGSAHWTCPGSPDAGARPDPGQHSRGVTVKPNHVWVPAASAPPAGVSLETVCEELGWEPARLLVAIRAGQLPSPDVFRGAYLFPAGYALDVRANGLRIPGMFDGLPLLPRVSKGKGKPKGKPKGKGGRK